MLYFEGNVTPEVYAMEWRTCARFPDYEVSEYGDIRRRTAIMNRPVGYRLRGFPSRDGYWMYAITAPGNEHNQSVMAYRLVAEAFLGPPPFEGAEVAHRSGSHVSAYWRDLRWTTRKDNHADLQVHGTAVKGPRNGRAKMTDEQAFECRYEYRVLKHKGFRRSYGGFKLLQQKYGLSRTSLALLGDGKTWWHLPDDERPL
jgi:hypothetical protein